VPVTGTKTVYQTVGLILLCLVFFQQTQSGTTHSHWHYEYVYPSLFFLGNTLMAASRKEWIKFYGCLSLCVFSLLNGFFHFPKPFFVFPIAVLVLMVSGWIRERWQIRVDAKRPRVI